MQAINALPDEELSIPTHAVLEEALLKTTESFRQAHVATQWGFIVLFQEHKDERVSAINPNVSLVKEEIVPNSEFQM